MAFACATHPVAANWLSTLVREAGEAGVKGASHLPSAVKLGPIGKAASHLADLKLPPKAALAAHATPEGHWQFANREGQLFTAATPDEMQRVPPSLLPDAAGAGETRLSLFVSEDSFFKSPEHLAALPKDADIHIVTDGGAYPVRRGSMNANAAMIAEVRPNLSMALTDAQLFEEAIAFLARPLNRADMRPLAVTAGGPKTIPSVPRVDVTTKAAEVDQIDAAHLQSAFRTLKGRTAVLTGRVEGETIAFGDAPAIATADIAAAARDNDVSLIVLHSASGIQPGGRNWLWQTTTIDGLSEASGKATMGDFLDTLAAARGGMTMDVSRDSFGRIRVAAQPPAETGVIGSATSAVGDAIGQVTGQIAQAGAEIYTRDHAAEEEQDARLIPFLPSIVQIVYLSGLVAGVLGFSTARSWWRWLYPKTPQAQGEGRLARFFKALPNEATFALIFLPAVGWFALFYQAMAQIVTMILAPFRWLRRIFNRGAA